MYNPDNNELEEDGEELPPSSECWDLPDEAPWYCPVCGEQVEARLFVNLEGLIIGCDNCVTNYNPYTKSRRSCGG